MSARAWQPCILPGSHSQKTHPTWLYREPASCLLVLFRLNSDWGLKLPDRSPLTSGRGWAGWVGWVWPRRLGWGVGDGVCESRLWKVWRNLTPQMTFLGPGCTWRCGFRDTTGVSGALSGPAALRCRTCLFSDLPGQQDAQGPGPRPHAGAGLQPPQAGELREPVSKDRRGL